MTELSAVVAIQTEVKKLPKVARLESREPDHRKIALRALDLIPELHPDFVTTD